MTTMYLESPMADDPRNLILGSLGAIKELFDSNGDAPMASRSNSNIMNDCEP